MTCLRPTLPGLKVSVPMLLAACSPAVSTGDVAVLEPRAALSLEEFSPAVPYAHQAGLLGPDRAVLYDNFAKRLHVVSLRAPYRVRASFGERGSGPGEIVNVWDLVTLDGAIALWDTPVQRLLVMDTIGVVLVDERFRQERLRVPSLVRYGPSSVAIMPVWATDPKSTAWIRDLAFEGGGEWRPIRIHPTVAERPGVPIVGGTIAGLLPLSWVEGPFEVVGLRDSVAIHLVQEQAVEPPVRPEAEAREMAERRALALALGQEAGGVPAPLPSPEEFRTLPFVDRLFVDECEDFWIVTHFREGTARLVLNVSATGRRRRLTLPWNVRVEDIRYGLLLGLMDDPSTGLPVVTWFEVGLSCQGHPPS